MANQPYTLKNGFAHHEYNRKTVSAVIPLLNEEKTIGSTVTALLASSLISEIICVLDDGSTDGSLGILRSFGSAIQIIHLGKNRGKAFAMTEGIKKAHGELILFCDADILNLSSHHVETLLKPFVDSSVRVVLGYPPARHYFAKLFLPLTGERVYYRNDLLPHLHIMAKVGYGAEMYLNTLFPKNQTVIVPLRNLALLEKREKHGLPKSFKHELRAFMQLSHEAARREGLLPREYRMLSKFVHATNLTDVKEYLRDMQSIKIKRAVRRVFRQFLYI